MPPSSHGLEAYKVQVMGLKLPIDWHASDALAVPPRRRLSYCDRDGHSTES